MTFIPEHKISEIKNSVDILDIISETVLLKKTGNNYVGLCPFHSEKTPSFTVSPEKQIFHCFGCSAGGNVFNFLMKHEGITFPEAVQTIARRNGITIFSEKLSPEQKKIISEKDALFGVNNYANHYFSRSLHDTRSGKQAIAYLNKRGISKKIIEKFQLGYAPNGWSNLLNSFSKKGIPVKQVEKAGLIVPRKEKTGYYDRFRNRIIFPISNVRKQIIGFGGRVIDDSLPKYINSPETPLYSKKDSLYAVDIAKQKIRATETVLIVEGYLDVLALHQNGIENSVATLGTSLTSSHVQILKGFVGKSGKAVLVYDSDSAGIKAAIRSVEIFDKGYLDARILILPAGHDPDSFLMEYGKDAFIKLLDKAKGVISFLIESSVTKHGLSVQGKIRIISDIRKPIADIKDNFTRNLYIKELAERIKVHEKELVSKLNSKFGKTGVPTVPVESREKSEEAWIERKIISMMLQFPEILPEIVKQNVLDYFTQSRFKSIGKIILAHSKDSQIQVSEIINLTDDNENRKLIARLAISEEYWKLKECVTLIRKFVQTGIYNKNKSLQEQIKEAERKNDDQLVSELQRQKQKMAVLNNQLKTALNIKLV